MGIAPRRSDTPTPGYYLVRLVRGGPYVGASISVTENGQWSVMRDGETQGPHPDPWALPLMHEVAFARHTSTAAEVAFRIGTKRYQELYEPDGAAANPRRKIDLDKLTPF